MNNVVFLELEGCRVATFDWSFPSGALIDRSTRVTYGSPNQVLSSGDYGNRIPVYLLDSGSSPGNDNAWCNFKCSGCHRPLQASRWWLYTNGGYRGMRQPENSLGRFQGRRGTEMADTGLRPYPPCVGPLPTELSDGGCWHSDRSGTTCDGLAGYYGINPNRFV